MAAQSGVRSTIIQHHSNSGVFGNGNLICPPKNTFTSAEAANARRSQTSNRPLLANEPKSVRANNFNFAGLSSTAASFNGSASIRPVSAENMHVRNGNVRAISANGPTRSQNGNNSPLCYKKPIRDSLANYEKSGENGRIAESFVPTAVARSNGALKAGGNVDCLLTQSWATGKQHPTSAQSAASDKALLANSVQYFVGAPNTASHAFSNRPSHHNGAFEANNAAFQQRPRVAATYVNGQSAVNLVGQPASTVGREKQQRRPMTGGGPLRAAKSETSLRTGGEMNAKPVLSDEDQYQIELMYSAQGSQVVTCGCLANLYFAAKGQGAKSPNKNDWCLEATGVPVLLLDYGVSRARTVRKLLLILAEKGTGFTLWRDMVDNLSRYSEVGRTFHTMLLSSNHTRLAGLSFDNPFAAMQFYQKVKEFSTEPENVSLTNGTVPKMRKSVSKSEGVNVQQRTRRHSLTGNSKKLFQKFEISKPCCFNHVTSLKPHMLDVDLQPKRAQSCVQIGIINGSSDSSISSPTYSV